MEGLVNLNAIRFGASHRAINSDKYNCTLRSLTIFSADGYGNRQDTAPGPYPFFSSTLRKKISHNLLPTL